MALVVFNGCFYQFVVSHENFIGLFDESPVPCQERNPHAFLQCRPENITVGKHIIFHYLCVADAIGFQQSHADDAGPILPCRTVEEGADPPLGVLLQDGNGFVQLTTAVRIGDDIHIERLEIRHHRSLSLVIHVSLGPAPMIPDD